MLRDGKDQRLLVLGATGNIGRHVVKRWHYFLKLHVVAL
jgi:nucleoside-diphosphate-sugar epimerase